MSVASPALDTFEIHVSIVPNLRGSDADFATDAHKVFSISRLCSHLYSSKVVNLTPFN